MRDLAFAALAGLVLYLAVRTIALNLYRPELTMAVIVIAALALVGIGITWKLRR